jgi:hypothetical protein
MNKKLSFIIVTILMIGSLSGQNSSAEITESNKNKYSRNTKENKNDILGEWGIYETVTTESGNSKTETTVNCNVCPKVKFETNHTGILIFPNGEKSVFAWKNIDNVLIIETNDKRNFFDENYLMKFTKKSNYTELELKETEKKYSYILRK